MRKQCEIRVNNTIYGGKCPFCGNNSDPYFPLAVFKKGTYEAVCHDCARKYAPAMADAAIMAQKEVQRLNGEAAYYKRKLRQILKIAEDYDGPACDIDDGDLPF